MLQQHAAGLQVAVVAGQHQQAVALVVAQVGRQPLFQHQSQHLGIAGAGEVEHLGGEFLGFFIGHALGTVFGHGSLLGYGGRDPEGPGR